MTSANEGEGWKTGLSEAGEQSQPAKAVTSPLLLSHLLLFVRGFVLLNQVCGVFTNA